MPDPSSSNTLGLDFNQLQLNDASATEQETSQPDAGLVQSTEPKHPAPQPQPQSSSNPDHDSAASNAKDKKKPYVNPERVKTGGGQRDKLSEQELSERMVRMREQNEKIKQRRLDVKADEDAFRQTQESDKLKLAKTRKMQESIDRAREQNAKRKMDKVQSREWDSGKPAPDWKHQSTTLSSTEETQTNVRAANTPIPSDPAKDFGSWTRGGPPRRGRGRGRGGISQRDVQAGRDSVESHLAEASLSPNDSVMTVAPETKA